MALRQVKRPRIGVIVENSTAGSRRWAGAAVMPRRGPAAGWVERRRRHPRSHPPRIRPRLYRCCPVRASLPGERLWPSRLASRSRGARTPCPVSSREGRPFPSRPRRPGARPTTQRGRSRAPATTSGGGFPGSGCSRACRREGERYGASNTPGRVHFTQWGSPGPFLKARAAVGEVGRQWTHAISPASTPTASRLSRLGRGHTANSVHTHGGLYARLKSSTTRPSSSGASNQT